MAWPVFPARAAYSPLNVTFSTSGLLQTCYILVTVSLQNRDRRVAIVAIRYVVKKHQLRF